MLPIVILYAAINVTFEAWPEWLSGQQVNLQWKVAAIAITAE